MSATLKHSSNDPQDQSADLSVTARFLQSGEGRSSLRLFFGAGWDSQLHRSRRVLVTGNLNTGLKVCFQPLQAAGRQEGATAYYLAVPRREIGTGFFIRAHRQFGVGLPENTRWDRSLFATMDAETHSVTLRLGRPVAVEDGLGATAPASPAQTPAQAALPLETRKAPPQMQLRLAIMRVNDLVKEVPGAKLEVVGGELRGVIVL